MNKDRKWHVSIGESVKQEAFRLGLAYESWEIVKLTPSVAVDDYEKIQVSGSICCHQCGKAIPFDKVFTWRMLASSSVSCSNCNVDVTLGAYDVESSGVAPLWVSAAPLTEHIAPDHRNTIIIQAIDDSLIASTSSPDDSGDIPLKITVEAKSVKAARDLARTKTTRKFHLLSEKIKRQPDSGFVQGIAPTEEEALSKARPMLPPKAKQKDKKLIGKPGIQSILVDAEDEATAKSRGVKQTGGFGTVQQVRLVRPARHGFLGLGRRPNRYEVTIMQQAVVELSYTVEAELEVEIGKLPFSAHCQACGGDGSVQSIGSDLTYYVCLLCVGDYMSSLTQLIDGQMLPPGGFYGQSMSSAERQMFRRLDVEGQRANSGQLQAPLTRMHCWHCGHTVPFALESICPSCGRYQNALLLSGTAKG